MSSSKSKADTNPAGPSSDPQSEAAPGVRTEAEVIADEQANAEQAKQEAPPGATGNPAIDADLPDEEDDGKLVHYVREDGTVQSVNAGSREHSILARSRDWEETTRAQARKANVAHSDGFKVRRAKAEVKG